MNLKTYYEKAISTAIYPNQGKNVKYPLFGLIGEIGELAEQIKKQYRDDDGKITDERKNKIKFELGDIIWYVANTCREFQIDFSQLDKADDLTRYMTPNEPLGILADMSQCFIELTAIDAPCENSPTKSVFRNAAIGSLEILFLDIGKMCELYDLDINDIMKSNIEKLLDRKDRNVIKGEGDER